MRHDKFLVTHNRTTHAVVSLFGYGIGVYEVNAIESDDHPHQAANGKKAARTGGHQERPQ